MSTTDQDAIFISSEKNAEKKKIDYSGTYILPSIKTRYFSTLIDVLVIAVISLLIAFLFEKIGNVSTSVRIILFFVVFIFYEPLLVSFGATVGQLVLNIRVRNFKNPKQKLFITLAIIRTFFKVILGWLSFI